MKSAAHILFAFVYVTMTTGFTLCTCTCWDLLDLSDETSDAPAASICCGVSDCSHSCCLKEASRVHLSDDHTTTETRIPADQKHLSTYSQLEFSSIPNDVIRPDGQNTGAPRTNALIQILHCSFLL